MSERAAVPTAERASYGPPGSGGPADAGEAVQPQPAPADTPVSKPSSPGVIAGLTPPSPTDRSGAFISDVLVEMEFADRDTVEKAVEEARVPGRTAPEVLLEQGAVTEDQLARAVAERNGLNHIDLSTFEVDLAVTELISRTAANRYHAVPVALGEDGSLLVAIADPLDILAVSDIAVMTRSDVRPAVASKTDIVALLDRLPEPEVARPQRSGVGTLVRSSAKPAGDEQADAGDEQPVATGSSLGSISWDREGRTPPAAPPADPAADPQATAQLEETIAELASTVQRMGTEREDESREHAERVAGLEQRLAPDAIAHAEADERAAADQADTATDEELERAKSTVAELRGQLHAATERITSLEGTDREGEASLKAELEQHEATLASLEGERERERTEHQEATGSLRTELEAEAARREAVEAERDAAVSERDAALAGHDEAAGSLKSELEAETARREAAEGERDGAAAERDGAAAERDAAMTEREAAVSERDTAVDELDAAVNEREAVVAKHERVTASLRAELEIQASHHGDAERERDEAIAERDEAVAALSAELAAEAGRRETAESERDVALAERDEATESLRAELAAETDRRAAAEREREEAAGVRDEAAAALELASDELERAHAAATQLGDEAAEANRRVETAEALTKEATRRSSELEDADRRAEIARATLVELRTEAEREREQRQRREHDLAAAVEAATERCQSLQQALGEIARHSG